MIESIQIRNVATFDDGPGESLNDLRKFNYIFGANGTGKTTISRVIADVAFNANCQCAWANERPLEALVLNRDFVDKSFSQLRGVFTLGERQKDTEQKIAEALEKHDREHEKLANLKRTLEGDNGTGGKKGDLAQLETDYRDKFWVQKQKHDQTLEGAFRGYMGSKEAFKAKVLQESSSNSAPLKELADLEKRAVTVFGEATTKEAVIPSLDTTAVLAHESNPILKKKVIGREDVDIAAMIKALGSSDWVRQGLPYYEANDSACPFCQQDTTEAFARSLEEYFDEAFEEDTGAINVIVSQYAADAASVQSKVDNIISAPSKFLDVERLKAAKTALDQTIAANTLRLDRKKKEPSKVVELESLDSVLNSMKELINASNVETTKHNSTVDNLAAEEKRLTAEVWRFVVNELEVDLNQYREKKEGIDRAIAGIERSIKDTDGRIAAKTNEIRELEKQTISIQPTINAINDILLRFGFDSFELSKADDGKHYKLTRQNGEDARLSLSEGEKTFVVFLYFYHLLKGSVSESGMTADRVVVFDDPVSSLDSDVLFVVSSLIKDVCDNCRAGVGHIKQVFVLTHNVYFHKEVTYCPSHLKDRERSDSAFWIVRKLGSTSKVDRHERNPVLTSYALLWMDVRNAGATNTRIENTLRRILEHYFTILGSIDRDDICAKFEGQDKLICKSLFSWVNAGSHSAFDDAHYTASDAEMQNYLRVFKAIFESQGHIAHYEMMMRGDVVQNVPEGAAIGKVT
jgi:wobble nucleotide-excising tRNase